MSEAARPDLDGAAAALVGGGVVAVPTDTVYGLAVVHGSASALERLYRLKGREAGKPMAILVDSVEQARRLGRVDDVALALMERFWPGPLTLVVPTSREIAASVNSPDPTVGLRRPRSDVIGELVARCGPLVVTSANPAGRPPATSAAEVRAYFGEAIDGLVDGGSAMGSPSTVVSVAGAETIVLREGDIGAEEIDAQIDRLP